MQPCRTGQIGASHWLQKAHLEHAPIKALLFQTSSSGVSVPGSSVRAGAASPGLRLDGAWERGARGSPVALRVAALSLASLVARTGDAGEGENEEEEEGEGGAEGSLRNQRAGCSHLGHHSTEKGVGGTEGEPRCKVGGCDGELGSELPGAPGLA